MANVILKNSVYLTIKIIAYIFYPLYLFNNLYLSRVVRLIRSRTVELYLKANGSDIGANITIGKNCVFRIQQEATIIIGDNVVLGDNLMLNVRRGAKLSLGNNCHINFGSRISCFKSIEIGNDTLIASYNNILDHEFDFRRPPSTTEHTKDTIKIGNGVWLGTKVQVGKKIYIGDFVVVGANYVVTKTLESSSVYGGVPAKLIRKTN